MTRRSLIKKMLMAIAAALCAWPVIGFIMPVRYRPPRKVLIREKLPKGSFLIEPEFVLFASKTGPVAVSRTCTHLGCTVSFDETRKQFICPCHQSMFHWNGKYISGPAQKDLPRFEVKTSEDGKGYVVLI